MRLALPLVTALLAAGCNQSPSDLREWRPQDHDHTQNPGQDQVVAGPDAGPAPELARVGLDEVTVIAWQQNCTRCHGRIGRGDGPQGAMLRPTDLTNPEWQKAVTDEQIATVIKNGRGAMPPSALPDATVNALVKLVRLLDSSKHIPQADASGSAAPSASAPPGAAASGKSMAPSAAAPSARPQPAPSAR